jgi:hypothetical protein
MAPFKAAQVILLCDRSVAFEQFDSAPLIIFDQGLLREIDLRRLGVAPGIARLALARIFCQ